MPALAIGRGDGSYAKTLAQLAKTDVLVIDDWGLAPLADESRRDLLEIFDDRHGTRSTIITSQLPVKHWHEAIGDPTLADAILDRLVHQVHSLNLDGESLRKKGKPAISETIRESFHEARPVLRENLDRLVCPGNR